ncbi:MAG: hypothetical protein ACE37F_00605 [Nannocystaceae bacterium]|nr:hypothetical protein [bacterium]
MAGSDDRHGSSGMGLGWWDARRLALTLRSRSSNEGALDGATVFVAVGWTPSDEEVADAAGELPIVLCDEV